MSRYVCLLGELIGYFPVHMGVQHKEDNRCIRATLGRALVKIMYHEFIIASTMLISEREAARFGYRRQ